MKPLVNGMDAALGAIGLPYFLLDLPRSECDRPAGILEAQSPTHDLAQ